MIGEMLTPPAALHALLFASGEPLEKKRALELLGVKGAELKLVSAALARAMGDSGIALVETESHLELRTAPEAASLVKKLRESELSRDLGRASLETLAAIAYGTGATRHPTNHVGGVTRGEVDWVRGVNSSASLRTLLMRGLIEGREDEKDRRRVRYRITTEALAHLGTSSVEALPRYAELETATQTALAEAPTPGVGAPTESVGEEV